MLSGAPHHAHPRVSRGAGSLTPAEARAGIRCWTQHTKGGSQTSAAPGPSPGPSSRRRSPGSRKAPAHLYLTRSVLGLGPLVPESQTHGSPGLLQVKAARANGGCETAQNWSNGPKNQNTGSGICNAGNRHLCPWLWQPEAISIMVERLEVHKNTKTSGDGLRPSVQWQ